MKKSLLSGVMVLFVFGLFMSSCTKDEDGDGDGTTVTTGTSGEIVGVWDGTYLNYTGTTTTVAQGQTITQDFVGSAYDIDFTFTISENPNEVTSDGQYSIELTTTLNGQSNTQNVENMEFLTTGTWVKNGNTMTITNDGEDTDATIVKLTDTELELKMNSTTTQDQGGIVSTSVISTVLRFTR